MLKTRLDCKKIEEKNKQFLIKRIISEIEKKSPYSIRR